MQITYGAADKRGLRATAENGQAVSSANAGLGSEEKRKCRCAACIYGPPPPNVSTHRIYGPPDDPLPQFATDRDYKYVYFGELQVRGRETAPFDCMVGPGHAVDLAPGQGYNASEDFRCEVEPSSHELGAFFGAWRIDPGACKPLDCIDYPRPIPNAWPPSQEECLRNMSKTENFRVAHGEKCKIKCNPGYEPQGTREYECDRGIFLEPLCVKKKCAMPTMDHGVYSPSTVSFGDKMTA